MTKKKTNKNETTFNEVYHGERNVQEGKRIYKLMEKAMLSADATIGGTVAMNFALSKLIANYKRAMRNLNIDVSDYLEAMTELHDSNMPRKDPQSIDAFRVFTENVLLNEIMKNFLNN